MSPLGPAVATGIDHLLSLPGVSRAACLGAAPSPSALRAMPAAPHSMLSAIGGAAARRRLHAIHPARPGQEAAASGFALALTSVLAASPRAPSASPNTDAGPVLWVVDTTAARESGLPYGDGFAALGLAPERLLVVLVAGAHAALAAAEMGLEDEGLAGVLIDLPRRLPADMLRAGKRLSLRAEARGTPCFLLHADATPVEMPAATRWMVASRPLIEGRTLPDPDMTTGFDVALVKNRFGGLGRWRLGWEPAPVGAIADAADDPTPDLTPDVESRHDRRHPAPRARVSGTQSSVTWPSGTWSSGIWAFTALAPPLPEPVATDPVDGSPCTAAPGRIVPIRSAA